MFSGLMLSQYTADMQIVEQRILSAPASIQSIPAAADQEDFVSMGMNTAIKNFQILGVVRNGQNHLYKFGTAVTYKNAVIRPKTALNGHVYRLNL